MQDAQVDAEVAPARGNSATTKAVLRFVSNAWPWLFLIFLLTVFETWGRIGYGQSFVANPFVLKSIAVAAAFALLLAAGQTLVIISGGIDLSLAFTMGLAAVVTAFGMNLVSPYTGPIVSFLFGASLALMASFIPGFINGFLVARLGVPAFIATLGFFGINRSAAFIFAGGVDEPIRDRTVVSAIGYYEVAGAIPLLVVITVIVVACVHYLLSQTRYGQYTYAIGGSKEAASRAGINVRRHIWSLYVLASLLAGLAGVLHATRFGSGRADSGEPLLLSAIAAVVVGGASLFGGSGTIIGALIGTLIISAIPSGLSFLRVNPFFQFGVEGVIIIVSVLIYMSRERFNLGGSNGKS